MLFFMIYIYMWYNILSNNKENIHKKRIYHITYIETSEMIFQYDYSLTKHVRFQVAQLQQEEMIIVSSVLLLILQM